MSQDNMQNENQKNSWLKIIAKYNVPDLRRSLWQLLNSFIPYVILWYLMYLSLNISYWLVILLAFPAAGFLIRLFIIFHDCGHGSFFRSKKLNDTVGIIIGILTFTPYYKWTHSHKIHHATVGDLDRRGIGDVWTLTVEEYLNLPRKKRFLYKMYRHPLIMFGLGSLLTLLVQGRFTKKSLDKKEKNSIYITNILLIVMAVIMSLVMGFKNYILIQLPIIYIATSVGISLFYLQRLLFWLLVAIKIIILLI
ncbi:fatty acid desaturase [candidate division KSB1 bacterium]